MATALNTVDKLTVQSLSRGFNQTSVLRAQHEIKKDDAAELPIGTEVTFTDDDLGFVFRGRIVDVKEQWRDGEGIVYECADEYRRLVKLPATINGSSIIKFKEGSTTHSVLTKILDELPSDILLGGYDLGTLPDIEIPKTDKGGQSVDNWINDVLRHTDDGVCWIEYVDVSGELQPKLVFGSMESIGTVDFQEGNYDQIDPTTDDTPLIVEGTLGDSLDGKYGEVRIEGCGDWERFHMKHIPHSVVEQESANRWVFTFPIPESIAMARYLDAEGNCRENAWVRAQFGDPSSGNDLLVVDMHNQPVQYDENTGEYFFKITIIRTGVFSGPTIPQPIIFCWFTYTGLVSTLTASLLTADSRLSGEGVYIEQHPELFKFYDPSGYSIDQTGVMNVLASALYQQKCDGPDTSGTLSAHIKGLDPDVVLGATIIDPSDLDGTTIRAITYDFTVRNMVLECSNIPLRPEVFNAQRRQEINSELGGNWYLKTTENDNLSCFCGGPIYTDEDGNRGFGNFGGDGPDPGPSWDCIQGDCIERDDNRGQYNALNDCLRDCFPRTWDFIPCVGCVPSDQPGFGDYATQEDCENDNPDPFDAQFNCGDGSSDPGSPGSPGSGGDGETIDCLGCGDNQVGFIKTIKLDRGGHVIQAICETCDISASASCDISGYTGTFSLVSSVSASCSVSGDSCWVTLELTYKDLTFENGLLKSVT